MIFWRKRSAAMVSAVALFLPFLAQATTSPADALDDFAWQKRQIILFAPTHQHAEYLAYKEAVKALQEDFTDRKLQTWFVIGDQPVRLENESKKALSAEDFAKAFNVKADQFSLILIGYDQGVKLRQNKVDIDGLFGEIDMMPLRIEEMQQKAGTDGSAGS